MMALGGGIPVKKNEKSESESSSGLFFCFLLLARFFLGERDYQYQLQRNSGLSSLALNLGAHLARASFELLIQAWF